jgi:hypothetical protein
LLIDGGSDGRCVAKENINKLLLLHQVGIIHYLLIKDARPNIPKKKTETTFQATSASEKSRYRTAARTQDHRQHAAKKSYQKYLLKEGRERQALTISTS